MLHLITNELSQNTSSVAPVYAQSVGLIAVVMLAMGAGFGAAGRFFAQRAITKRTLAGRLEFGLNFSSLVSTIWGLLLAIVAAFLVFDDKVSALLSMGVLMVIPIAIVVSVVLVYMSDTRWRKSKFRAYLEDSEFFGMSYPGRRDRERNERMRDELKSLCGCCQGKSGNDK